MRKVLFITLSNIGDVILTLPVLSGLKRSFPEATTDVMVGPRPYGIFKKDPRVKNIYIYDKQAGLKEKISFLKKLRDEKYDLAVDMRASLVPLLIGAKKRSSLVRRRKGDERHKRSIHLNKLKELGLMYEPGPSIYIDDSDRKKIEVLLSSQDCDKGSMVIGISPSTRGTLKQWHTDGFIEVIQGLLKDERCKIVLIGDKSQVDISRKIMDSVKEKAVIDLTGKVDLSELFALVERMQILLTGDSAGLHIASDLGIKTVALFGPTDPEEYGPRGKDDIVIRKKLKCSPCKKATCAFGHECMKEIRPEEVLKSLSVKRWSVLNGSC
ncbi:MAG: glycosyltransferase family 9 protein [Candidatus Omnitrophica bacterium]|nr:glycosyltransferase family 9 protein [Candidatus Omnitrophota bacterium]